MSEAVRVSEGGRARAKFARGRRTLRVSARVLRGGCGPRVHGKPADLERVVGASGGGREGWRVRREASIARRERAVVVKMMCLATLKRAFHSYCTPRVGAPTVLAQE